MVFRALSVVCCLDGMSTQSFVKPFRLFFAMLSLKMETWQFAEQEIDVDISVGPDQKEKSPSAPKLGIQVIARAVKVLRALEGESNGLSLTDIAARVDLPRSTVQRIVAALANEQFLISASPTSRVKLGPALIRLASATRLDVSQMVRPYIQALSRDLKETVDLSIIQGHAGIFVDQALGSQRLRTESTIGERFPLHCTACGKSLLATLSDDKIKRILDTNLTAHTRHTIVDRARLSTQVDEVRKVGIAYDFEEYTEGVRGISVSFFDSFGRAYAISIPTPTARLDRSERAYLDALLDCREQVRAALGRTEA